MARVGQDVDERGAQPLGVGDDGRHVRVEVERDVGVGARRPRRRRPSARQTSLRSASAQSKRIGLAKSSTSVTMRFSRVRFLVDVRDRLAHVQPP